MVFDLDVGPATITLPEVKPADMIQIQFTSGTTGRSKAVQVPHGQYTRGAARLVDAFGLRETDVPLPLGWMLSREAARAMREQVYVNDEVVHNRQSIDDILKSLPPLTPTVPAPAP